MYLLITRSLLGTHAKIGQQRKSLFPNFSEQNLTIEKPWKSKIEMAYLSVIGGVLRASESLVVRI